MTKVFAYLRVSTAQQTEGDGFPRQLEAVTKFCESRSWVVSRSFREQQSGSDAAMDRPKLMEALDWCTPESGFNIIVVERADRIARDLIVSELFFAECKARGVRIYAADSGEELVNADGDPTRVLIRQILGALAQWDKTQICRKLQAGRRKRKFETGKPCGGPAPFGEHRDGVIRASQRATIKFIWDRKAAGDSLSEIVSSLEEESHINASGTAKWSKSTVANILHVTAVV